MRHARPSTRRQKRVICLATTILTTSVGLAAAFPETAANAAPPPLTDFPDYSASNSAPNGVTPPIRYGTDGKGSTQSAGCTTTAGSDFQSKIDSAAAGAVICVQPGDYSPSTLTVGKAVTVRANGVVKIKNIVITGLERRVDGFNVVGGTLGNPNYAVKFSGTGHQIINNLVRGRGIYYAIGCEQSAGCGSNVLISGNTITGVHNFGIYLWGGDHITVEKNNIFDLYQSTDVDDVDAMRPGAPTTWYATTTSTTSTAPRVSARRTPTAIRPTRPAASRRVCPEHSLREQLLRARHRPVHIVQNDQRNSAELQNLTLRGNVCEAYGWQSIEFDAVPNITMDNNYVAGGR